MAKWCLHASLFIFERIIIKVAGNQDRGKSLDELDFGPLVSMANLCFLKWDLTWAHWTQVSDRCPLGYLYFWVSIQMFYISKAIWPVVYPGRQFLSDSLCCKNVVNLEIVENHHIYAF